MAATRTTDLHIKVAFTITMTPEEYEDWQEANNVQGVAAVKEDVREFLLHNVLTNEGSWQSVTRNL